MAIAHRTVDARANAVGLRPSHLRLAESQLRRVPEHVSRQLAATMIRVSHRGFTLLELLLAVSIFALVLAAINSVFYAAMRLQRSAARTVEEALPIQQALVILKKDLQGIVAPGGVLAGPLQPSIAATGNAAQM